MIEIIANNYLTQSAEVAISERVLVKRVLTPNADLWREATDAEIQAVREYQEQNEPIVEPSLEDRISELESKSALAEALI